MKKLTAIIQATEFEHHHTKFKTILANDDLNQNRTSSPKKTRLFYRLLNQYCVQTAVDEQESDFVSQKHNELNRAFYSSILPISRNYKTETFSETVVDQILQVNDTLSTYYHDDKFLSLLELITYISELSDTYLDTIDGNRPLDEISSDDLYSNLNLFYEFISVAFKQKKMKLNDLFIYPDSTPLFDSSAAKLRQLGIDVGNCSYLTRFINGYFNHFYDNSSKVEWKQKIDNFVTNLCEAVYDSEDPNTVTLSERVYEHLTGVTLISPEMIVAYNRKKVDPEFRIKALIFAEEYEYFMQEILGYNNNKTLTSIQKKSRTKYESSAVYCRASVCVRIKSHLQGLMNYELN